MSNKVVTEYMGIKYSLQPHGWKSRLMVAFFLFVLAFGGALAVVSPAQAAPPNSIFVTVCGDDDIWYVNADEGGSDPNQGDRRPKATSDGLVFGPRDLIHHETSFPITPGLNPGTFVADPKPDQPSFFSIEVWNDDGSGYATLRWDSTSENWSLTTGGSTFTGSNPKALLESKQKSTHARSFGVGYTNSPPGSVTSLVSSLSFRGTTYDLSCPPPVVSSPSPSPVIVMSPSPVVVTTQSPVTVPGPGSTKVVTVIQKVPIIPVATTTSSTTEEPSPSSSTSPETGPQSSENSLSASPVAGGVLDESSGGESLKTFGILVAGASGLVLLGLGAIGVVGAVKRRRQRSLERQNYQGSHHVDDDGQEFETNNTYDDYNPAKGEYDSSLETRQFPPVRDSYPGEGDTRPMPPVE